jgi:hypothetical protein
LKFLGISSILGRSRRHPIEKVGERWGGGRKSVFRPHVEGAVGFSDLLGKINLLHQVQVGVK